MNYQKKLITPLVIVVFIGIVFFTPGKSLGEVVTINDTSLLQNGTEMDVDGDGEVDFHFYHISGPTSWNLDIANHVEFILDENGELKALEEGYELGADLNNEVWGPAPIIINATGDYPYHSRMIFELSSTLNPEPQEWLSPSIRRNEAFLGFRILLDSNYTYGYLHIDPYRDVYIYPFDGEGMLNFFYNTALANVLSISHETTNSMPIAVINRLDKGHYVQLRQMTNGPLLDYSGIVQNSKDLISWENIDPQPVGPFLLDTSAGNKEFFRIKKK